MTILSDLKKAQAEAQELPNAQTSSVTVFDPQKWGPLATAIAKSYPALTVDADQVRKGGKTADGNPIKLAVFVAPRNRAEGIPSRNVTLYSSGKAVWTNLEAVAA